MMQKSQLDHKDASATQREQGESFHSPDCLGKSHQHLHPLIPNPDSYMGISVMCFWIMVWNKKVVL